MPQYKIKHVTRYTYASPVIDCTNQVLLYPVADAQLEVRRHELVITNNPPIETYVDYFGNTIGVFSFILPHNELSIASYAEVVTKSIELPADSVPATDQWQQLEKLQDDISFIDFLSRENFVSMDEVQQVLHNIFTETSTPYQNAQVLNRYIYENFTYQKGITDVETKMDEIWKLKAGVCQDFAHIMLVMLRLKGIPARYVSGYICPQQQEIRGEGATHAWVEAYIPFYGWLGLDPTNNCVVNDRHVKLAVGRSFTDCTPVKGTYKGGGAHTLDVYVKIENGSPEKQHYKPEEKPVFTYTASKPVEVENSYRQFVEIQQQQQQQQ